MLFRRSGYEKIGGDEAVASVIVEDVELAASNVRVSSSDFIPGQIWHQCGCIGLGAPCGSAGKRICISALTAVGA